MLKSEDFLKKAVLGKEGIDLDTAKTLLDSAGAGPGVAERAHNEGLLSDEDLTELLTELAEEASSGGDRSVAESLIFGKTVVDEGMATALEVWTGLREQEAAREEGRERSLDFFLAARGTIDTGLTLNLLEKQGKGLLVCRDCGRREIVAGGGEGEPSCPDCAGILLPADQVKKTTFEAQEEEGDPLAGMVVGGCRVEKKLGAGGMGYVYKARHLALNKPVAVKFLSEHISNEHAKKRFLKEARTAARLDHANIVAVHDTGIDHGKHYIVMQFVEGESVSDRIKRDGPLPVMETLDIAVEAARGIAAAHHLNMIHRDIKPDNVMLDKGGAVKVADFGLAKDVTDASGITVSQQAMGTPHYMSPEQANDARSADARADIYSLGATIYAMLAGTPPFTGSTPWAIISQHQNDPLPDIREKHPDVPAELSLALEKMMEKNPEDRFETMDDVIETLLEGKRKIEAAHDFDSAPTILPTPPQAVAGIDVQTPATYIPPEPHKSRTTPILGGVAVLAVAGLVIAVLALSGVLGPLDPGKGGGGTGTGTSRGDTGETKKEGGDSRPNDSELAAEAEGAYVSLRARAFSLAGRDEFEPALAALAEFPETYRDTPTWVQMEKDRAEILALAVGKLRHELGRVENPVNTDGAKNARNRVRKIADFLQVHKPGSRFDVGGFESLAKEAADRLRRLEGYIAEMDWIDRIDREGPTLPDEDLERAVVRLTQDVDGKVPGTEAQAKAVLDAVKKTLELRREEETTKTADAEREKFTGTRARVKALTDRGEFDEAMKLVEPYLESPVAAVRAQAESLREELGKAKDLSARTVRDMGEIEKLLEAGTWKGLGEAEGAYSRLADDDPPPNLVKPIGELGERIGRTRKTLIDGFAS
ncbi:MAG: protein kinase domain-containing protein, partial [Planctomycetota bacterium]